MSYAGGLAPDVAADVTRPLYAFLRRALLTPPPELPVRGPAELSGDGMRYDCSWRGSLQWFHGTERIERDGRELYALRFAGGMLA